MTIREWNDRLDAIIDALNDIQAEKEDLEGYGVADLETALDMRADEWEGDGDCPAPTPDEIDALRAQCDRNAAAWRSIDARESDLLREYYLLADTSPQHYDATGRFARKFGCEKKHE